MPMLSHERARVRAIGKPALVIAALDIAADPEPPRMHRFTPEVNRVFVAQRARAQGVWPRAPSRRDARPVHEAITYIESHHPRMSYAVVRAAGLPIGNTEASCKTLVQVRMKRAGARWNTSTGRHVLQLRALATSDRWDHAMKLTLQPLRKAVRVAA